MSRMMRCLAMLLIPGIAVMRPALTQELRLQDLTLPKITAEAHALDALLGKWNCLWDLHSPRYTRKVKVTWAFARVADGFMVYDEYRADNGSGGTVFLGETYRAYNPVRKTWTFRATQYVTPESEMKSGEWDAGTTRFDNGDVIDEIAKGAVTTRFRFYNIKRSGFAVGGDRSQDGGKTWHIVTNIECMRARR